MIGSADGAAEMCTPVDLNTTTPGPADEGEAEQERPSVGQRELRPCPATQLCSWSSPTSVDAFSTPNADNAKIEIGTAAARQRSGVSVKTTAWLRHGVR